MKLSSNQPGFWAFRQSQSGRWYFDFVCPCGCGDVDCLPLYLTTAAPIKTDHHWGWDGNQQRPTLTPSLRKMQGCLYHGNLTAGKWMTHGDGAKAAPNVYSAQ